RAEALHARVVLVAAALVDLALAPEPELCAPLTLRVVPPRGSERLRSGRAALVMRQHRDAVALHRAVAAALADVLVDEDAARRIRELALLAPPPLLGRAGLLVDQHGDAFDLAQPALHGVERLARV